MFEKSVKHRANDASNDVIAHPYPHWVHLSFDGPETEPHPGACFTPCQGKCSPSWHVAQFYSENSKSKLV